MFPAKLNPGNEVRVIAPSLSLAIISEETQSNAKKVFADLGLKLTFGKNVNKKDQFMSTPVKDRVQDLHEAFADQNVKAIFTVLGGFNSNQLLPGIDWEIIKNNPKIFCGYSDITALQNAIFAKTGLVTYSGPHFSTFGQKILDQFSVEFLKKCLFSEEPIELKPAANWTDDAWYLDQDNRNPVNNDGYWSIQPGQAEGVIIGANLCTLNLLQGTPYFPNLKDDIILFVEDDASTNSSLFNRDLESLLQTEIAAYVKGLAIGRFQKNSKMDRETLEAILADKPQLKDLPIVANVDFGHTNPMITLPVGGSAKLSVTKNTSEITILKH